MFVHIPPHAVDIRLHQHIRPLNDSSLQLNIQFVFIENWYDIKIGANFGRDYDTIVLPYFIPKFRQCI